MNRQFLRPITFAACLCALLQSKPPKFVITTEIQAALDAIRAGPLRGDLSFLASDLLEGRNTPSRGLDIAAEYIASQFRGAGLDPVGDDGYFQTAHMTVARPDLTGFEVKLTRGQDSLKVNVNEAVIVTAAALDIHETPVFKLDLSDGGKIQALDPAEMNGKVVLFLVNREGIRNYRAAMRKLSEAMPAAILSINRSAAGEDRNGQRFVDPEAQSGATLRIELTAESAVAFYTALKSGPSGAIASIHVAAPVEAELRARNVIGVLRGSDPALKDTAVFLTAHYDHLGEKPDGAGDRIYNGANDDGSGTVSVIEIARALSSLKQRPRRSIVFMTFFGEEEGMVGSNYYVQHPVWPLNKTIADVNLEQVGRTDSSEGRQISNASVTGFDYSEVTEYLRAAGDLTGIKVYKHPRNDAAYFSASDNLPFARAGVPAHTLCVAFEFPDYHAVGDEWQKIDYANMAKVDRAVALALVMLAESDQPPHWNASEPGAAQFRK